jgi:hypothetical protein
MRLDTHKIRQAGGNEMGLPLFFKWLLIVILDALVSVGVLPNVINSMWLHAGRPSTNQRPFFRPSQANEIVMRSVPQSS